MFRDEGILSVCAVFDHFSLFASRDCKERYEGVDASCAEDGVRRDAVSQEKCGEMVCRIKRAAAESEGDEAVIVFGGLDFQLFDEVFEDIRN